MAKHQLPKLPWAIDALEPNYLKSTLEFHYGKHHQTYIDKLNAALEGLGEFEQLPIEELMKRVKEIPDGKRQPVINNGGGHYNHTLFWNIIGPSAGGEPQGKVAEAINEAFGSFAKFKEEFTNKAIGCFGSGWTWLTVNEDGSVQIENSANQDNCLMNSDRKPILVIDVWEHAYYLEHQNKRPAWIETFFKMIDWKAVEKNYENAMGNKAIIDLQQAVAA
jgi:Fe-Mn family superoxide dismutase